MKQFRCNFCGKNFKENGNLRTHIRLHSGYRPYVCKYVNCGKSFVSLGNLKSHEYNHSEKKPFKCSFAGCGRYYSRLCRLEIHERTHIGLKPFNCPFENCDRSFNEKGNLKTHLRIHTGEKPFACDFPGCGLSFKAHGHLKDHKKRHTNTRPYKCHLCDNAFARTSTLKIHLHTHQGDKPHKCPFRGCSKYFSERGNMKSHYKNHFINKKNFNERFEIDTKIIKYGNNSDPNEVSLKQEPEKEIEVVYSELINLRNDLKFNNDPSNKQFSISSNLDSEIIGKSKINVDSSCNNFQIERVGPNSIKQNYQPEIRKLRRIRKPLSEGEIIRKYNFFKKKFEEITNNRGNKSSSNQGAENSSNVYKNLNLDANFSHSTDKSLKEAENMIDPNSNGCLNNLRDLGCNNKPVQNNSNNSGILINSAVYDIDNFKKELKSLNNNLTLGSVDSLNQVNGINFNPNTLSGVTNSFNGNINNISQNTIPKENLLLNNFNLLNNYNNCFLLNGITMINGSNMLLNDNINNNNNNNVILLPNYNFMSSSTLNQQLEYLKYNSDYTNRNINLYGNQLNYRDFGLFNKQK